jgi:uncharacterized protein YrrD
MLTKAKRLQGFKLSAVDGEIGSIKEFFFDDKYWTIRYLVVNTGGWLSDKKVLISPYFLKNVDYESEHIHVSLTKDEIEKSPPLESDMPISRQYEESYYSYYQRPVYWEGPLMWGGYPDIRDRENWDAPGSSSESWDPNLRSSKEITGYNIQATDDEIGHVDDFIIDDESWAIRYFIIDTKNWWPGKKVLISTQWIDEINLYDSKVHVGLTRDTIKQSPEYDEDYILTREYETNLHEYYGRQGYWSEEPVSREHYRGENRF